MRVYRQVSRALGVLGVRRSPVQCREKIKKLKVDYRKMRGGAQVTDRRFCKLYPLLDAVMKRRGEREGEGLARENSQPPHSSCGREAVSSAPELTVEMPRTSSSHPAVQPCPASPPAVLSRVSSPSLSVCSEDCVQNTAPLSPERRAVPLGLRRRGSRGPRQADSELFQYLRESDSQYLETQRQYLALEREERARDREAWQESHRTVVKALLQVARGLERGRGEGRRAGEREEGQGRGGEEERGEIRGREERGGEKGDERGEGEREMRGRETGERRGREMRGRGRREAGGEGK
ncbi:undifferentiated embryonic cell transcription factor 1-like [Acipenser oxyrinchus oxyrinchus]|uniref:Undifferentiated embryonic cell transcription factor 1-like n=1 Tax=Acipenser oxyrinchus oxyrinchus TaxID=40147 RepID=A0AAD8FRM3_ACIOX|nr:undifferentiated embryonic cell transcription factor 1-like [Acipenser oxyrinchus oxyrinchus]